MSVRRTGIKSNSWYFVHAFTHPNSTPLHLYIITPFAFPFSSPTSLFFSLRAAGIVRWSSFPARRDEEHSCQLLGDLAMAMGVVMPMAQEAAMQARRRRRGRLESTTLHYTTPRYSPFP